jgi:probable rRNA maturation factor
LIPIRLSELSVVFLDDAEMAELHGRLTGEATATDILTLDYDHGQSEIFISLDTARRQAGEQDTTLVEEVRLYLAHGLLHLSGYDDHTAAQRRQMRLAEGRLLKHKKIGSPLKERVRT